MIIKLITLIIIIIIINITMTMMQMMNKVKGGWKPADDIINHDDYEEDEDEEGQGGKDGGGGSPEAAWEESWAELDLWQMPNTIIAVANIIIIVVAIIIIVVVIIILVKRIIYIIRSNSPPSPRGGFGKNLRNFPNNFKVSTRAHCPLLETITLLPIPF